MTKVSVIIPCYNQEKYIADCLESILAQTFEDYEAIVIDDGSIDNSVKIVEEYQKKSDKIRLIRQENQGVVTARNNAIKQAKGKYIYPLDADDIAHPEALEKSVEAIESGKGDIISCKPAPFNKLEDIKIPYTKNFSNPSKFNMAIQTCILNSSLYRKSDFEKCGGYDKAFDNGWEDYDLWLNMIFNFNLKVYRIPEFLFFVRTKDLSESRNKQADSFNVELTLNLYKKYPTLILYRILHFFYQKKITNSNRLIIKICKIPVFYKKNSTSSNPVSEIFWKFISIFFYKNKYQRKNFYKAISRTGISKYLRLKKVVSNECANPQKFKYNVSIVAIAKNEGIYFKEWIEYHKLIGIEHFYIYNNDTEDNTKEILTPYIENGLVTWIDIHGKSQQANAYNDAINQFKNETRWLCPLDLDEFICLKKHQNVNEFMDNFKDCFQVSIRWMMYGSSGHIKQPQGLVIENFTKHAKECSSSFKSIFNPRAAVDAYLVHNAIGVGKWVDENRIEIGASKPTADIVQINHYFTKSKDEFINRKVARGSNTAWEAITNAERTFNEFQLETNDQDDDLMTPYATKLKKQSNTVIRRLK